MSTINDSDLLLVERNGNLHQITYDQMSTLNDDDILLVERGGVQYKVEAQYVSTGPNGVILPSVEVLTPLNGAGLNDGQSYTPMSSAYVSTDTTPVIHRYFPELIVTVSGGSWVNEDYIFDGDMSTYAELTGADSVVSQIVFTPNPQWTNGETTVYAYAAGGGSIEVLDTSDTVLRTYSLPLSAGSAAIGIVRVNENKIRITTTDTNASLFLNYITRSPVDYVIDDRVAFEFTDDTDLDKMVAPIIQTDENGNVKIPTTSTVDSTTTIPGSKKFMSTNWTGSGYNVTFNQGSGAGAPPVGDRMTWAKVDTSGYYGIIADNVSGFGAYLETGSGNGWHDGGPYLRENESEYNLNYRWNRQGYMSYVAEIGVAPKVLDIVTWAGNDSPMREIPHNLGTVPGMIIVKRTSSSANWMVWHKDLTPKHHLYLNLDNSQKDDSTAFPTQPTKDHFYVGGQNQVNGGDQNFVAYVFAADTAGKVKCGIYEGDYSNISVDLGFKAGFFLTKCITQSYDWTATTLTASLQRKRWNPNQSYSLEGNSSYNIDLNHSSWLNLIGSTIAYNTNNEKYVYLAIAHDVAGPNSTQLNLLGNQDLEYFPAGTKITSNLAASGSKISFGSDYFSGDDGSLKAVNPTVNGQWFFDIQPDTGNKWLIWAKCTTASNHHRMYDSERNYGHYLRPSDSYGYRYDTQGIQRPNSSAGYIVGDSFALNNGGDDYIYWNFLAAPQFFDIQKYVGYQGSGGKVVEHDLGVDPGMIIIKNLTGNSNNWVVWHHSTGNDMTWRLNQQNYPLSGGIYTNWCSNVTDKSFTLKGGGYSEWNSSNQDYIAYVFAKDTPYVKCGTYAGTGSGNNSINVGFRPRWMLIKRTNSYNDWWILEKKLSNKYITVNESYSAGSYTWSFTSTGVDFNLAGFPFDMSSAQYMYVAIADESEGHPPNAPSSSTVQGTPDVNAATMVVNAESFDVGDTASAAPLEASITSVAGSDGNKLYVDASTGTWVPGLFAKGAETTVSAPAPDEITFTSQNQGTPTFSGVDATLASRTWTLESGTTSTGPWTLVDTYVDYDVLNSQTGATPWTSNKPNLTPNTFYRVKVQYNSTNAESVESVYHTFKTGSN